MSNFFSDNEDIQFLFQHMDLARVATLREEGFRFAQTIEEIKASGDFDALNEIYLRMHTTFTEPYLTAFTAALTYRREIVETDA